MYRFGVPERKGDLLVHPLAMAPGLLAVDLHDVDKLSLEQVPSSGAEKHLRLYPLVELDDLLVIQDRGGVQLMEADLVILFTGAQLGEQDLRGGPVVMVPSRSRGCRPRLHVLEGFQVSSKEFLRRESVEPQFPAMQVYPASLH